MGKGDAVEKGIEASPFPHSTFISLIAPFHHHRPVPLHILELSHPTYLGTHHTTVSPLSMLGNPSSVLVLGRVVHLGPTLNPLGQIAGE